MTSRNTWWWYTEAEVPVAGQPMSPASDPTTGANPGQVAQPTNQAQFANQPQPPQQPEQDNVENDPATADIPDDSEKKDFEQWRHEFFELAIKGDTNEMMASIGRVRDHHGLNASQRRFVEDNIQILIYRQSDLILPITKEVRKTIMDDLDTTYPGTTVAQHITAALEKNGIVQQILIKFTGLYGLKGELHRKFIAALTGSVQVGGGNKHREDLVYPGKDLTINLSTRFFTEFGEISLGAWNLKEDDPDRFLADPEMDRLTDGSPEERQVLRRRIILNSIAEKYLKRAFIIHIVHTDGTIYSIGWDLGNFLMDGYQKGKLVVRGKKSEKRDAQISDDGTIVPLIDLEILYVQETGETDEDGHPEMVEVPFMERRDSLLYLVANPETIRDASSGMAGLFLREMPYNGNPSDILALQRAVPDLVEMLNKRVVQTGTVALPKELAKMDEPKKEPQPKVGPPNSQNAL